MLWVRNGYVELTIILNHKNIQYMFTLPFLHTLPIIITNKETAFSDLVIFWLITMSYWFIHQITRKEEVCGWQCLVPSQTLQFQTRSKISWWAEYLTPEVPGWLTFLCCSCVHRHVCTSMCAPACVHRHARRLCSGQQHLPLLLDRGQGLWKGTWLRLWPGWPGADCKWWGTAQRSWPGDFLHCCAVLGMQRTDRKERSSSPSQACVRSGRGRGWAAWH